MENKLIIVVEDYLNKVEIAKNLMIQGLLLNNFEALLKLRERMPHGTFYYEKMKHTFTFHGIGCRFSNEYLPNVSLSEQKTKCLNIDFELSGIDPWKLFVFIEEYYPEFKTQFTKDVIVEEFNIGIKEKTMYKKFDLYYFK